MAVGGESLKELNHLRRRLNKLFDEMIQPDRASGPLPEFTWMPSADVFEDDRCYCVEVELPGVAIEDVVVTVDGNVLSVSGQRKPRSEISKESAQRIERYVGPFLREFSFPEALDAEPVEASLRDGVLRLTVPKREQRRKVQVR